MRQQQLGLGPRCFLSVAVVVVVAIAIVLPRTVALGGSEKCLTIPSVAAIAGTKHRENHWTARRAGERYIAANHKTGSLLAICTCRFVDSKHQSTCLTGGYPAGHFPFQHSVGQAIVDTNFCVNFVRNPFVMVHSGMVYHKTTNNPHEGWLHKDPLKSHPAGVGSAVKAFANWCMPSKTPLTNASMTYQEIMQVGTLLLFKWLSLSRVLPYYTRLCSNHVSQSPLFARLR